jgi:hypothetical protein
MDHCPVCNSSVLTPNIRIAQAERAALVGLYEEACNDLDKRDARTVREQLEAAMVDAKAVVALPIAFTHQLVRSNSIHQTYHQLVESEVRRAASLEDDIRRGVVDNALFGSIAKNIHMAAVSLDGRGLKSYGSIHVELKSIVCENRATLLIENSFNFIEKNARALPSLPKGFRATWADRAMLAVVKLAPEIALSTVPGEFPSLILTSSGDRRTDRFMEVHVWRAWDAQAISKVGIPATGGNLVENAQIAEIRDRLLALSIPMYDVT